MSLTPKQAQFVREYLIDLNATQAAIRAGYSAKTAGSIGQQNLMKLEIANALRVAQSERAKRTEITADRVLTELAKIGFADIRKAVTWRANVIGLVRDEDGGERLAVTNEVQVTDSDKLDEETAAAIAEISQTDKGALRVKLHDKRAALVDIGRHLGMFVERRELTGKDGAPLVQPTITVTIGPEPPSASEAG